MSMTHPLPILIGIDIVSQYGNSVSMNFGRRWRSVETVDARMEICHRCVSCSQSKLCKYRRL